MNNDSNSAMKALQGKVEPDAAQPSAEPVPGARLAADLPEVVSGANALVAAANLLLNLIPQIRVMVTAPDPASLHRYLADQIRLFESRAHASGVPAETVIGARYCLCTALDETAAQTPWGGSGVWPRHSLLVALHNETWGGEKFFQLLAKLVQSPRQHLDLIELMYYCLAMGFEGRYRIVDNGRTQLIALKQRLVQTINATRSEFERTLSPHWRGQTRPAQTPWTMLPLWVAASLAILAALGVFFWLLLNLSRQSDDVFLAINGIKTAKPAVRTLAVKPRLRAFLEPEIREGLVEVRDEIDRSVVILKGDGMFNPGSNEVKARYLPVIARIADGLATVSGSVAVVGHTDNIPIRTVRFPSNWQLSKERASAVSVLLQTRLPQPERFRTEGRAEAEPVASNDTPENRSLNRRVEIILQVPPAARDAELNRPQGA